jgi:hypothetical protein
LVAFLIFAFVGGVYSYSIHKLKSVRFSTISILMLYLIFIFYFQDEFDKLIAAEKLEKEEEEKK